MHRGIYSGLFGLLLLAGCAEIGASRAVVGGAGPDDLLKLRAGPGLDFRVILGLPDGTLLDRGTCVTETGQLWCKVSLVSAPDVSGYVSADYLRDR